jgi:ABC-type sugar transport system substrate-binding protein
MKKLLLTLAAAMVSCASMFAAAPYTVAYMTPALSIPFWKDVADGLQQQAEKVGNIRMINSDSRLSAETQLKNAQDLITAGVNCIVISPTDSASCPAVLELAKKSKVPVVICDIGTDSGDYAAFVISDNYGGANAAGKYMVDQMKKRGVTGGDLGVITISLARQNGRDRTQGFRDALKGTTLKVAKLLECKEYTRAESMRYAQDILTAQPRLVGLFTEHDEANLGSMPALDTSGKAAQIINVGFDGSPETVQAIKDGRMYAAAMQQPVLMGRKALEAAVAVLAGKPVEKKVVVPTILVTKENVAMVEKQLADNVYPNELKAK